MEKEKEHTRAGDALAAELREMPVVPVTKDYTFTALDGSTKTLEDLFGTKSQLIVYHFMLGPDDEEGCRGCSFAAEHFPDIRHLGARDTAFTAVSRAPAPKIAAYQQRTGWKFPWVSSNGSDFNYDYMVSVDEDVRPMEYNYTPKAELEARVGHSYPAKAELPGLSVFKLEDGKVYHSYSTYARGLDRLLGTYTLLDMTPLGRQDKKGTVGFKRNYEYEEEA